MTSERPDAVPTHCVGFDDNARPFNCMNPPGTPWTPYWCLPCDEKRRAHISANLKELQRVLAEKADTA